MKYKQKFFHSLPLATGDARKLQVIQTALLAHIHEVCERNGLRYWLNFGGLIGAVRHGGCIPWDDDLDIGMISSEREQLVALLKEDTAIKVIEKWLNLKNGSGIHKIVQITFSGLHQGVDIFSYDFCENGSDEAWNWYLEWEKSLIPFCDTAPKSTAFQENAPENELRDLLMPYRQEFDRQFLTTKNDAPNIVWSFDNVPYFMYQNKNVFPSEMIFPCQTMRFENITVRVPHKYSEYLQMIYGDIFTLPQDMLSHKHFKIWDSEKTAFEALYQTYRHVGIAETEECA